jgi:hypothetical protein
MKCENCEGPMTLYLSNQRFCCRACSDEWFQEERRQAVAWFRACGMTVERGPREERAEGRAVKSGHAA